MREVENGESVFPKAIVYENPNLPGNYLLHLRNSRNRYSIDLTQVCFQRSLGWIDFRISGAEGIAEVCDPVDSSFVRGNHICGIFVDKELRGRGIGTDLVRQAALFLLGKGVEKIVFKGVVYSGDGFYGRFNPCWQEIKTGRVIKNFVKKEDILIANASFLIKEII